MVETFRTILEIRHIFTFNFKARSMDIDQLVSFPSIIYIDVYFTFQFHAKYNKIVLVFHLHQAVLTLINSR